MNKKTWSLLVQYSLRETHEQIKIKQCSECNEKHRMFWECQEVPTTLCHVCMCGGGGQGDLFGREAHRTQP